MRRVFTIAHTVWLEMVRRKDMYVLLVLLLTLLFVLMSLNVFGLAGMVRHVLDTGLLLTWLFGWVLAVNVSTRQLPREESQRTIYPLLAKPVSRAELLVGKWLGACTITGAALVVFYLAILLLTLLRGGRGAFNWVTAGQAFFLHFVFVAIVAAVGTMLSTRMNYDASASISYVLTLGAFLIVPRVPHLVTLETGFTRGGLLVLYYLLPHLELFDLRRRLVHDWGPANWSAILFSVAYGLLLVAACLLLAWLGYRKKRFSRSDAI